MIAVLLTAEVENWMTAVISPGDRAIVLVELERIGLGVSEGFEICGFEIQSLRLHDESRSKIYFRRTNERIEVLAVDDSSRPRHFHFEDSGDNLVEFDPVKYLDEEATIVSYLIESQATGSSGIRFVALQNVCHARFLNDMAIQAGVCRFEAYEFFRSRESLCSETITRLLSALRGHRLLRYVSS